MHRAIGKVHRRRALKAFDVKRAAFGHVVGHVGNVHAEPVVPVRQPLDADRVIEVARVLAVDRHRRGRSKIRAAGNVFRADRSEPERFLDCRLAVRVGNPELADDDLGIDALLVDVSEDLDHLAHGPA